LSIEDDLSAELERLEQNQARRALRSLAGPDRIHPALDGRQLVAFCSNDYLGLAAHPALTAAAATAATDHGFGSGASRLVSGGTPLTDTLEDELASFVDQPAALLFPTGYQTNIGVLTALAGPSDLIASDAANHASIVDGCRLSRARIAIYRHTDARDAARALATPGDFRRRILVTESLFSMDGTRAPLATLAALAKQHDALFIVDEAHALGVLGPGGRGLCHDSGVRPHLTIGTLGKAFAALGGFAAGSRALRDLLLNTARTFIFTTAAPHPIIGAALAALRLIRGPEGDLRRARLAAHLANLRAQLAAAGFPIPGTDAILPVILGSNQRALAAAANLLAQGLLVPAIRPPTVPPNTARLRITLSADHTPAEVASLARALTDLLTQDPGLPQP
jgi:8-amino-7-oxononanoate synthase